MDDSCTVAELRSKADAQIGDAQGTNCTLIFKGTVLKDDGQALSAAGIADGDFIITLPKKVPTRCLSPPSPSCSRITHGNARIASDEAKPLPTSWNPSRKLESTHCSGAAPSLLSRPLVAGWRDSIRLACSHFDSCCCRCPLSCSGPGCSRRRSAACGCSGCTYRCAHRLNSRKRDGGDHPRRGREQRDDR